MYKYQFKINLLLLLLPFCLQINAQTKHTVTVTNFIFSPSELTVSVGDTVLWNCTQGIHSATADDGSFDSGNAKPAPWTYEFVFDNTGSFRYYCRLHGGPNGVGMSGIITVVNPTGINNDEGIPTNYFIEQNYPNPFNPSTAIRYGLPQESNVVIKIYSVLGQEINELKNESESAGFHQAVWKAGDYSSGIYLYSIDATSLLSGRKFFIVKKMLLLK